MIKLHGNENSVLSIKFEDILHLIPEIKLYKWKLVWIDGVNSNIEKLQISQDFRTMEDFFNVVNNSSNGYSIDVKELIKLSKSFYQLYELILIGDKKEENLELPLHWDDEQEKAVKKKVEFYIELIDTSYWEITSKNELFNQNLINNLPGKKEYIDDTTVN